MSDMRGSRIRSFFIKDILEHRTSSEHKDTGGLTHRPNPQAAKITTTSSHTVEDILRSKEKQPVNSCSAGYCDCPKFYSSYKNTPVTASPLHHPYLLSYFHDPATWTQSIKVGAYVDAQNTFYSYVKQRKPRRPWTRAVFSNLQRKGLEKRFQVQKYLTKGDRHQLASMLGLSDNQVKVWFQNRRMKWRQEEQTGEEPQEEADVQTSDTTTTSNSEKEEKNE